MERTQANPSTRIGADFWQIYTMQEITFMEPIRDIKLAIIGQEEQLFKRNSKNGQRNERKQDV